MGVDLLYDLIIIVPETRELPIENVEPGEVLSRRRVALIDAQLSSEEAREDEFRHIVREARFG